MRDTIDPNAPFDTRFDDLLSRIRAAEGEALPSPETDPVGHSLNRALAALRDATGEHLSRIDAALARIIDGEYGYCDACSAPIELDRLERDPATPHCASCCTDRQG